MKKILIAFILSFAMVWTINAWAGVKDGLWEITTQVQMKGMPQQMPPTTFRQCITQSDPVVKNQDKNFECRTVSLKKAGDTVSYAVECKGSQGTMFTEGKNTFTGSRMDGTASTSFKMKGQPAMQLNSKMSGKYIGPCQ